MSSFAGLKAARAHRQKSLATRMTNSDVSSGTPTDSPARPPLSDALEETTTSDHDPENGDNAERNDEPMDVVAVTSAGESSTPVTGLPRYTDFPEAKLEIRKRATAGRGLYVRSGVKFKQGESIIQTSPAASALAPTRLASRCSRCWLDEREVSIARGTMHEFESQVQIAKQKEEEEGGLKRCTGCKVVRYCSTECQTADWPSHAQECRAFKRLRRVSRKNRHRTGPQTSAQEQERRILKTMRGEIDEDEGVPGWIPPDDVRVLGKLFWGRRKAREKGRQEEGRYWAPFAEMQSHRTALDTSEREPFARLALRVNQYLSAAEPIKEGEKEEELIPVDMSNYGFRDVPEVLDLCTAHGSNSFTLSSSSLEPIGTVISPLLALLNHSCEPNAVVVFPNGGAANEGKPMELVALRDIGAGEEILTCYVDVASPMHVRQKELKETYRFECTCALCSATTAGKVDPRWALRHPDCGGPVRMPDLNQKGDEVVRCEACQISYSVDVDRIKDLFEFSEQLLQEDAHGLLGDFHASKVPSITNAMSEFFLPSSYPFQPLLRLRSLLASQPTPALPGQPISETVKDLFDAIEAQALVWKGMKVVYPNGHPSLGIALAELGKLLNLDATEDSVRKQADEGSSMEVGKQLPLPAQATDRLGLARETLGMALEQLRIGFGSTGGLVGKEVEGIMEGLTKEMKFKGLIA